MLLFTQRILNTPTSREGGNVKRTNDCLLLYAGIIRKRLQHLLVCYHSAHSGPLPIRTGPYSDLPKRSASGDAAWYETLGSCAFDLE